MAANPEAFKRARAMAEGIVPKPYSRIQSRSLGDASGNGGGWGADVQPARSYGYFDQPRGAAPINRPTMGGGIKHRPVPNLWRAVGLPTDGPARKV